MVTKPGINCGSKDRGVTSGWLHAVTLCYKGVSKLVFPFERDAEQGMPMPDGLSLTDQLAYQFLKNLYERVKRGSVTREQAILEKGKMTHQYNLAKEELEAYSVLGNRWAGLLKRAEGAQIRYQMDRTLENADLLSAVLNGRLS